MQQPELDILSSSRIDPTGTDEIFDVTEATVMAVPAGDKIEVTVTEAAELLDVSKRTMWRRIRSGEFASRYDGRQTFVAIPATLEKPVTPKLGTSGKKSVTRETVATLDEVTVLKNELERTKAELQAASNRVQYLQGQVDLFQDHFKLLVDRHHKAGWWRRFCSWFAGSLR